MFLDFILKQGADGLPVADICRKAGISQATYLTISSQRGPCCFLSSPQETDIEAPAPMNGITRFSRYSRRRSIGQVTSLSSQSISLSCGSVEWSCEDGPRE